MSKFVTGPELENVVCDIIWGAKSQLLIVSPFIKLDGYFKTLFDNHIDSPNLHICIVFGKNESDVKKSLSKTDFEFFKKFLNVSIVYVQNLHGKYYGNEFKGIITSINLYDYSFKNNIEFGVFAEVNSLTKITGSPDEKAWQECLAIANSGAAVFIKRPVFEKKIFSAVFGKNYIKSNVLCDFTEEFYSEDTYSRWRNSKTTSKRLEDFPIEIELGSKSESRPSRDEIEKPKAGSGFCIHSGVAIPFNKDNPLSSSAKKEWERFGAPKNHPENFCHFSGEDSFGETSFRFPILKKYWQKAKEVHGF